MPSNPHPTCGVAVRRVSICLNTSELREHGLNERHAIEGRGCDVSPDPESGIEGIAKGTLILNGGYKVLTYDEVVEILKASF